MKIFYENIKEKPLDAEGFTKSVANTVSKPKWYAKMSAMWDASMYA